MPGPFYFAWAGGAIEEQLTLVTNGTTQGAPPKLVTIVGDIQAGHQQITNLASTDGLETGTMYKVAGPGGETLFIYDSSVLSGLPGSINLLNRTPSTQNSGQYEATQAIPLGTVLADLSTNSPSITLHVDGLPPGTYCVSGAGIAETLEPIGTTEHSSATTGGSPMRTDAVFINWDGSGSATAMFVLGASSHTSQTIGDYGEPETLTIYSVAQQFAYATQTGQSPVLLSGFPALDPYSVTDVPTEALARLTPGLKYNITGNGVPVGATFVAPSSGTSIALDLPTTASDINSIFTITGPRTPNQAAFDPAVHDRFDEEIIDFDISQEEGGFATLTVNLKNPGIGLLAQGRYLWCWLSWDQSWSPDGNTPDLLPLFNGRLIGAPKLQAGEIVQLQFLGRPDDFNAQKEALAASLKVSPYFDPVWLTTSPTADTVLEAYSALWHIDRVTLAVTISDILEGEDGAVNVGEDLSLYEHFSLSYAQPPLVSTMVTGTVTWVQQATGSANVTQILLNAFHKSSSDYRRWAFATSPWDIGGDGLIMTLSGNGLKSDWPKPGTSLGGGWSLSTLADGRGTPLCYCVDATQDSKVVYNLQFDHSLPPADQTGQTQEQSNVSTFLNPSTTMALSFPLNVYKIKMTLDYRANRKRTETITAVLTASVQPELSDSAESDRETISLSSEFVGQAIDPDGSIPIGNVAYRSYFQTGRGAASFEYLLLAARAKLRARARSVDITFAVPWRQALGITLRHSVQLTDYRLPGGNATGKVKSYKLNFANGVMFGEFTIGCSIGTGEGTTPQAGVNSYVVPGYVDPPYQVITGAQVSVGAEGELAYQALDNFAIDDDGLDLTNLNTRTVSQAVNACTVLNGLNDQMARLNPFDSALAPQNGNPATILAIYKTTVTLDMKPVQGSEFSTAFFPGLTPLMLPKTIDLSAAMPGD
jgi:hypothetical protein